MPPPRTFRAALLTGSLLGVASLPGPLGPLALVAFVPLLRVLGRGVALPTAFRAGFLAGLLQTGLGFGWVPLADTGGGMALPLAYLAALPLLAAGFGAFALLVAWACRRAGALGLAAAPGVWVALEYARSQEWLLAVPWNHLGYALADWPSLIQGGAYLGLYGLGLWIVAVNALAARLPELSPGPAAALVAAACLPLLPALALLAPERTGDSLRVVAVQPHLSEAQRRDPARFAANLAALHAASERALAEPADLVAWPESAYQRPLGARGDAFLAALAHDLGAPLLTGVWKAPEPGREGWRNAAVLALPSGVTLAAAEKEHPVPVYERRPDGAAARGLARLGLWSGRFEPGRPGEPLRLARAGAEPALVGVLVCIDASHPEIARRLRAKGARLLVAIANEAGTGRWSAELHARATRLRAVENRMPVVRVANTGPSLWIDERGRVAAALPAGRDAAAGGTLALAGPPPPFVALGDAPVAAGAALGSLVVALSGRARRRRRLQSHPLPEGALT